MEIPLNVWLGGGFLLAAGVVASWNSIKTWWASRSVAVAPVEDADAQNWAALRRLWKLMKNPDAKAAFRVVQTEVLDSVEQA